MIKLPTSTSAVADGDGRQCHFSSTFDNSSNAFLCASDNLLGIIIVNHDNLYTVNNLKLTEDHPVYLKDYTVASVNPSKTLENYEVTAAQLAVGDKLMKEDGTLETVTSIEVLAEEHVTYTLKTTHGNFYANNYLVDSEI